MAEWLSIQRCAAQSCLILWDPMKCSPPGSSVHGILQVRILEWVAMSSSRGSSRPRDQTQFSLSRVAGRFFTAWAPGRPRGPHKPLSLDRLLGWLTELRKHYTCDCSLIVKDTDQDKSTEETQKPRFGRALNTLFPWNQDMPLLWHINVFIYRDAPLSTRVQVLAGFHYRAVWIRWSLLWLSSISSPSLLPPGQTAHSLNPPIMFLLFSR